MVRWTTSVRKMVLMALWHVPAGHGGPVKCSGRQEARGAGGCGALPPKMGRADSVAEEHVGDARCWGMMRDVLCRTR